MTDMEILESCRLVKKDENCNIEGFKYAALLLFGTDDAIAEHLPRYKFELLYHKMTYERFNMNLPEDSARYDDLSRGKAGNVTGNATGKEAGNVSDNILTIIKAIGSDILAMKEIMERLSLKGSGNFRQAYLYPTIEEGYILRTEPDKLKSPNQKYYLSDKGKALLQPTL